MPFISLLKKIRSILNKISSDNKKTSLSQL
jgi:hypothetical protein